MTLHYYHWLVWGAGALVGLAVTAWVAAAKPEGQREEIGIPGFWLSVVWPVVPAGAIAAAVIVGVCWLGETSWRALCRYRAPEPRAQSCYVSGLSTGTDAVRSSQA